MRVSNINKAYKTATKGGGKHAVLLEMVRG